MSSCIRPEWHLPHWRKSLTTFNQHYSTQSTWRKSNCQKELIHRFLHSKIRQTLIKRAVSKNRIIFHYAKLVLHEERTVNQRLSLVDTIISADQVQTSTDMLLDIVTQFMPTGHLNWTLNKLENTWILRQKFMIVYLSGFSLRLSVEVQWLKIEHTISKLKQLHLGQVWRCTFLQIGLQFSPKLEHETKHLVSS